MPKKFLPTNFSFILNDIRTKKKITQYRVEKDLNYSRESVDAIENMRTNPSLHSFINLMNYFGYDIEIVNREKPQDRTTLKLIND
jgi:transcriptional regulator with XRE-family HTH domain